jgi:Tfp pilus assembly protein PilX
MFHSYPEENRSIMQQTSRIASSQQGIAMVVALMMLLVLVGMAVATTYFATIQANMVSAVTSKPISIDAGETCFDNAIEWLSKGAGQTWVNGVGAAFDLASAGNPLNAISLLTDTTPLGQTDTRSAVAKDRASRAQFHSCVLEKASSTTTRGVGYEVGTSNGYGASSFVYTIRMTAIGDVNVQTNGALIDPTYWQPHSGRSTLEMVLDYTP